jgi:hypothetical protein
MRPIHVVSSPGGVMILLWMTPTGKLWGVGGSNTWYEIGIDPFWKVFYVAVPQ